MMNTKDITLVNRMNALLDLKTAILKGVISLPNNETQAQSDAYIKIIEGIDELIIADAERLAGRD